MKQHAVKLFFVSIVACMIVANFPSMVKNTDKTTMDMTLENIEALAQGEGSIRWCIGSGSIDCNGVKVELKIDYR